MLEKIAAIIEDIFEYDASKVTEETNFDDDLYADIEGQTTWHTVA